MELIEASTAALDRYIGYYEPYATSHDALDRDAALQQEVRHAAAALVGTVRLAREGRLARPQLPGDPRPK